MVLSVSATGILNCAALLFLPAILAVIAVAALSSELEASVAVLAAVLLGALTLALALGRWSAARLGGSLLELEVEAAPKALEGTSEHTAAAGGTV